MTKKEDQLQDQLDQQKCKSEEREKSDKLYSMKWVERMAIWALAIIGSAILGAWISLIIRK